MTMNDGSPVDPQGVLPYRSGQRWLRALGVNAAGALMVALLLQLLGRGWSFGATLLVALVFANSIGIPSAMLLPLLTRRLAPRGRAVQWAGLLTGLLIVAGVGSLAAGGMVVTIGLIAPEEFWSLVSFGLHIGLVVTLGIGASLFLYESAKLRLEAATLELKATELARERAERLATEARLAALEARLHPHFFFNTVNAIAALIRKDPALAERLLVGLAGLLRVSLGTAERRTIPLGEELAVVRAYLEIQAARLGARLRYAFDIPREFEALEVPALSLHTLVDNSVTHVAAERREGAAIRIEGLLGDRLALRVWDDGPGFRLEAVPPGRGLDTLRGRLAALYGADAALEIARADGGTWVTLFLPRRQ